MVMNDDNYIVGDYHDIDTTKYLDNSLLIAVSHLAHQLTLLKLGLQQEDKVIDLVKKVNELTGAWLYDRHELMTK